TPITQATAQARPLTASERATIENSIASPPATNASARAMLSWNV
ncbi:MAG: hypothetical protein JWP22_1580, partial [Ramlibacter sp.]|nr:hypothetical protein [Ramlibacter sp.]